VASDWQLQQHYYTMEFITVVKSFMKQTYDLACKYFTRLKNLYKVEKKVLITLTLDVVVNVI